MASRANLIPISKNKAPTAEDYNALAYILNGSYSNTRGSITETSKKGLGMPVRLTGFDGRMATGLIDATSYALDVRNREATQQRALAVRKANGTLVLDVRGGLVYAPLNGGASASTQVLVNGSTAGGVLTGTYPDPGFWLTLEQYKFRPKMVMAWAGSNATVLVGGNLELQDAPGWVLCNGASVTMRDGSTVTVPNAQDRYFIGAGGTYALGVVSGNGLSVQQGISIAHGHSIAHTHAHHHVHEHTTQAHSHNHRHAASDGSGALVMPNHQHAATGLFGPSHLHTVTDHSHSAGGLSSLGHTHGHGDLRNTSHGHNTATGAASSVITNANMAFGGTDHFVREHDHGTGASDNKQVQMDAGSTSGDGTATTGNTGGITAATNTGLSGTAAVTGNTANDATANITGNSAFDNTTQIAVTTTSSTETADDSTAASPAATSSQTTLAQINAQPPTYSIWWIFKL